MAPKKAKVTYAKSALERRTAAARARVQDGDSSSSFSTTSSTSSSAPETPCPAPIPKSRSRVTKAKAAPKVRAKAAPRATQARNPASSRAAPKRKPRARATAAAAAAAAPEPINKVPQEPLNLFVFGSGECGELGLGQYFQRTMTPVLNTYLDADDPSKFTALQVACGGMHVVALTKRNKIVTWGVNDNGALGRNTYWDEAAMASIKYERNDSDTETEQEPLNPFESVPTAIPSTDFAPGTVFVQVAAGDSCSFALTDMGLVYGWGSFLDDKGNKRFGYDGDGEPVRIQRTPILIKSLKDITQIACGANHALALDKNGQVWGWGSSDHNQLGRRLFGRHTEDQIPLQVRIPGAKIKYIASGEYHAFAVDVKDNVWAWGINNYGEAAQPHLAGEPSAMLQYPMKIKSLCGQSVVQMAGGAHHSGAVTADGRCFVWGRFDSGALGINFTRQQLDDGTLIMKDDRGVARICLRPAQITHLGTVKHIGCGSDHTIFIDTEGGAHSSGFNTLGQLGLGHDNDVDVAEYIGDVELSIEVLSWSGAGGQFSAVVGAKDDARPVEETFTHD